MDIYRLARFEVHPDALDEYKKAIQEFVEYAKMPEPGTLRYSFFFKDEDAHEVHSNSTAVTRFSGILYRG